MSIQTELTRLTNAKAAIQTAIEGKGVTVPSGTLLDGMAALIESIEAGSTSNNIVVGSFTLSESLTTSSPLYIDVTFPKDELPLMYLVYEDTSNLSHNDTSHTASRLRSVIAIREKSGATDYHTFMAISSYNNASQYSMKYAGGTINYVNDDYPSPGGVFGSMTISLVAKQIRFAATSDGEPYLGGKTYNYILYWGD